MTSADQEGPHGPRWPRRAAKPIRTGRVIRSIYMVLIEENGRARTCGVNLIEQTHRSMASIYAALARLHNARIIRVVEDGPQDIVLDGRSMRRRYYELTDFGRRYVADELGIDLDPVEQPLAASNP